MTINLNVNVYFNDKNQDKVVELLNSLIQKFDKRMSALDEKIAALQSAVEKETAVEQSAITLINGIPQLITDAVQQAIAAGATPEQLSAVQSLVDTITNSATNLATAVTTNTPAAPAQ